MINLKTETYQKVLPAQAKQAGINLLALPRLNKIVVNLSSRELINNETVRAQMIKSFGLITGQKPILTRSKKSISGFQIRAGDTVGLTVTLHGQRMYDFLSRVINIALPRTRDFRGIDPKSFDATGNLTLAIREHTVFPEISPEEISQPFSLEITLVFRNPDPKLIKEYLSLIHFPLRQNG